MITLRRQTNFPVLKEESAHPNVCSILTSSMKLVESRPGVKTSGIIATLIKQQEQLNVSQYNNTADNSIATLSAFTPREEIFEETSTLDFDDTLETEHDVFSDYHNGDDSDTNDNLDTITVEGSLALQTCRKSFLSNTEMSLAPLSQKNRL
jgi:hypothetical protein